MIDVITKMQHCSAAVTPSTGYWNGIIGFNLRLVYGVVWTTNHSAGLVVDLVRVTKTVVYFGQFVERLPDMVSHRLCFEL